MHVCYVITQIYTIHVSILQKVEEISRQNVGHVLSNSRSKVRLG